MAGPVSSCSISCLRPRARPRATSLGAVSSRLARPARSSACSACCWPPAGSITRSIARAVGSWGSSEIIILLNLVFGFAAGGQIDNAAHIGGLVAGLWLGALIVPTGVPTLSSLWHRPNLAPGSAVRATASPLIEVIGVMVVVAAVATGVAVGTAQRNGPVGVLDQAPRPAAGISQIG